MGVKERLKLLEEALKFGRLRPEPVRGIQIEAEAGPLELPPDFRIPPPTLETFGEVENPAQIVHFPLRPTAYRFAEAVARGTAREIICYGARGDRKSSTALVAMLWHAIEHRHAGFPLPVPWMSVRDTHQNHRLTTVRTLQREWWQGIWRIERDEHLAIARVEGEDLVVVDLFGVEDKGAMDRLRMEVVGVHFEEVAPAAVLVQSSGVSEDSWTIALTSQRLPSHCHPAIITTNLPDEDHWSWQRFVVRKHPGTLAFHIPPGESASAEQREEWARILEGRPDLLERLLKGRPGAIALGPQVAVGYNPEAHVAREVQPIARHEPVWMGWDAGHTPTVVIGQRVDGHVRIYAGLVTEKAGTKQHLEQTVLPWLARRAAWALRSDSGLVYHRYDPSMDTGEQDDIDQSPLQRVRESLGGVFEEGATSWPGRRDPMLALFNLAVAGRPVLQIDPGPDTELLRRALSGRWYYRLTAAGDIMKDLPHKPNHPWEDLGDAFCYLIGGLAPSREYEATSSPQDAYATTSIDLSWARADR